jgi:hypothetical protein
MTRAVITSRPLRSYAWSLLRPTSSFTSCHATALPILRLPPVTRANLSWAPESKGSFLDF